MGLEAESEVLPQQRCGGSRAEASSGRQHPMEGNTGSWQFLIAGPTAGRAWSLGGCKQEEAQRGKPPGRSAGGPKWDRDEKCLGNAGGSTILRGRHVPPPSLGSAHRGSGAREELGVDGKAPCYWTSWSKAVIATKCGWAGKGGKHAGEMSAELPNTRTCPPHLSWAVKWDKCNWVNSRKVLTFQKSFAVLPLINLY